MLEGLSLVTVPGFAAQTLSFTYPHEKKSHGVRSGERKGYSKEPLRLIHLFSKSWSW